MKIGVAMKSLFLSIHQHLPHGSSRRRIAAWSAIAIFLVFTVSQEVSAQQLTPALEIHVFDVGQGDSTLVIGPPPQKKTLLIDIGEEVVGKKTHYKEVAAKIRKHLPNIQAIDYVVISHYHMDHMGPNPQKVATACGDSLN